MQQEIDYGNLMHRAMRGLIQNILQDVAADGLPGEHHFFITFDTRHEDAQLADWLLDRFPQEMTVVIQHEYEDLIVTDEGFSITLSFGDAPETLYIPYDSLKTFVDPSVEFGLRFETQNEEDAAPDAEISTLKVADETTDSEPKNGDAPEAEVVSLDSFRK
jgi:hypothetical protein